MQLHPRNHLGKLKSAVRDLLTTLKRGWRGHCRLLANPVYGSVVVIATDVILNQIDVPAIMHTLRDLLRGGHAHY